LAEESNDWKGKDPLAIPIRDKCKNLPSLSTIRRLCINLHTCIQIVCACTIRRLYFIYIHESRLAERLRSLQRILLTSHQAREPT